MAAFRVGHGRACITPPLGIKMMGYAHRTEGAQDIHDDLFVNAVALEANGQKVLLLAHDLCFFDLPLAAEIKSAIEDNTGLAPECVLLNTSHTHAGPRVGAWHDQEGDEQYERSIIAKSVAAAGTALAEATESAFLAGSAPVDIGCNRREMTPEGKVILGVNSDGQRLPEMTVWRFTRPDPPDIVVFSTAMHGTTLGGDNLSITAEWMGAAVRQLEAQIPDVRCVFLQGFGADQNPYRENTSLELVEQHGRTAAAAVMQALEGMRELNPTPLVCRMREVPLPLLDDESKTWPLPLHGIRIGDALLVGLGCEAFVEYAVHGRRVSPAEETLVLGYTDGSVGYLPTADAYKTGGYETVANRHFPVGSPFVPRSEQIVKDTVKEMLEELAA
ncbi:MAG: hypothetical protein KAX44_04620 [Candidatus Brocadiae bacterium]|nr:hypothetical protein [Candidatus Brocadiia bacterium]